VLQQSAQHLSNHLTAVFFTFSSPLFVRFLEVDQLSESRSSLNVLHSLDELYSASAQSLRDAEGLQPLREDTSLLHLLVFCYHCLVFTFEIQSALNSLVPFLNCCLLLLILYVLSEYIIFNSQLFKISCCDNPLCGDLSLPSLSDNPFSLIHLSLLHHLKFFFLSFFSFNK